MPTNRYHGEVEEARRDLRRMGIPSQAARAQAPHVAALRAHMRDRATRPYSWLGGSNLHKVMTWRAL